MKQETKPNPCFKARANPIKQFNQKDVTHDPADTQYQKGHGKEVLCLQLCMSVLHH